MINHMIFLSAYMRMVVLDPKNTLMTRTSRETCYLISLATVCPGTELRPSSCYQDGPKADQRWTQGGSTTGKPGHPSTATHCEQVVHSRSPDGVGPGKNLQTRTQTCYWTTSWAEQPARLVPTAARTLRRSASVLARRMHS
jgi:hypothetical protein